PSFTFEGVRGTRPVLIAVFAVFGLQLLFTYAPLMRTLFQTEPLDFVTGLQIVGVGVLLLVILEVEKFLRRGLFPGPATARGEERTV
ncbi:MAG TPA: cation transporting ATPase C-terminal domain-containing protein, partial [Noviherbaspirillum sp.]|nr:cation transporting ATPase C-terminal domain-containing protein [Noviherbaspirillum sp.]